MTWRGYESGWILWAIEESIADLSRERRKERPTSTTCESERLCKVYFDVDFFCGRIKKKQSHAFCKPCQAATARFRRMIFAHANIEHHLSKFNCGHTAKSVTWNYCGRIRPVFYANGARAPACKLHACFPCLRKKEAHDANFYAFVLCYKRMQKDGVISTAHMNKYLARIVFSHYQMNDTMVNEYGTHYLDDKPGEYRALTDLFRERWSPYHACPMKLQVCQSKPVKFAARMYAKNGVPLVIRGQHCSKIFINDGCMQLPESEYCWRCIRACTYRFASSSVVNCEGIIRYNGIQHAYCAKCLECLECLAEINAP